jgi:ribosomal protein S18 acetylase RimI-like enzyme
MENKILHFSDQKDKDFINNNPIYKKDFEDLYNVSDINEIFNNFKDSYISIVILDNHIVSMAAGWEDKDCLSITDVFTSTLHRGKGLCKSVVGALLKYWWDNSKLQFKNDFSIKLGVTNDNIAAIKCYKYFGFTEIPNSVSKTTNPLGEKIIRMGMILTKESYAETYLLPQTEKKLQERLKKK